MLLLSVPYALKAADAQTLGGLPASAFVQAFPGGAAGKAGATSVPGSLRAATSALPPATSNVTTTGGTAQHLAMFTKATIFRTRLCCKWEQRPSTWSAT